MKILYVAMKYDYGDPARGSSFEHANFFDTLAHNGHELIYFDFMSLMQKRGRWWMNRRLEEVARSERPDLLFCVLYQEQLDRSTLRRISSHGWTKTVNWFCDDHWRFDTFSRYWAPCFDLAVTTDWNAIPKYRALGCNNVLLSQWAANPYTYRDLGLPKIHDVTFVGQPHGMRRAMVQGLRDAGVDVKCWGRGWEGGRVSQDEMVRIFNQSRINLNLANPSTVRHNPMRSQLSRLKDTGSLWLERSQGGRSVKSVAKSILAGGRYLLSAGTGFSPGPDLQSQTLTPDTVLSGPADQIKGRNFEVPGCGGLLLTPTVPYLEHYYRPGDEVVTARTLGEMVQEIRRLLADPLARDKIAASGYQRTQSEHTYVHRFSQIFNWFGYSNEVDLQSRTSTVLEIS